MVRFRVGVRVRYSAVTVEVKVKQRVNVLCQWSVPVGI